MYRVAKDRRKEREREGGCSLKGFVYENLMQVRREPRYLLQSVVKNWTIDTPLHPVTECINGGFVHIRRC